MFKLNQAAPKLTTSKIKSGQTYSAFKKTMKAANDKALSKDLQSIRRTISNPLPSEGKKESFSSMMKEHKKGELIVPGVTSSNKGGRSRRRRKSRKKRRKRKTKRKKSRKKRKMRKKSRRKRRR